MTAQPTGRCFTAIRGFVTTLLLSISSSLVISPNQLYANDDIDLGSTVNFVPTSLSEPVRISKFYAMTEDNNGFLWFATDLGLARWDGTTTDVYNSTLASPIALPTSKITGVAPSPEGVWIAMDNKLATINPWSLTVTETNIPALRLHGGGNTVWATDKNTARLVSTEKLSRGADGLVVVEERALPLASATNAMTAVDGQLVIATSLGLEVLDAVNEPRSIVIPQGVTALTQHQGTVILAASASGLWRVDLEGTDRPKRLAGPQDSNQEPRSLSVRSDGSVWMTLADGAIVRVDVLDGSSKDVPVAYVRADEGQRLVEIIGQDKQGGLWISAAGLGIFRHNERPHPAKSLGATPGLHVPVSALSARYDDIWVGTAGLGLKRVGAEFADLPLPGGLQRVTAVTETKEATWFTDGNELYRLDRVTGVSTRFPATDASTITALAGTEQDVWVGYESGSVQVVNGFRTVNRFLNNQRKQSAATVRTIVPDGHSVWIGTDESIVQVNTETGRISVWIADENTMHGTEFVALRPAGDLVWIASNAGLESLNTVTGEISLFGEQHGIRSKINAIELDPASDALWLATNDGLLLFDSSLGRPLRTYRVEDGLAANVTTALGLTPEGRPLAGTTAGLSTVADALQIGSRLTDRVFVTQTSINGQLTVGELKVQAPAEFSFHFGFIEFNEPHAVVLSYRLVGVDEHWIEAGAGKHTATYSGLSSGEYEFHVRALTPSGDVVTTAETEPGATVRPILQRPWHKTTLFRALGVLLLILAGLITSLSRSRRAQRNAANLELLVTDRTKQLADAVLQSKQAAESQSRFLAMISHELRTPLSSVLGFAQLIENSDDVERSRQWAGLVEIAGEHLNDMIEELLATASLGRLNGAEYRTATDLRNMVTNTGAIALRGRSSSTSQLNFDVDENLPSALMVDRRRLRQVLLNLVDNALRHGRGKPIIIGVHLAGGTTTSPRVRFSVRDHGDGIEPDAIEKLFEPFYRVHDRSDRGLGLGLSICEQLVSVLGGDLTVDSRTLGPTTFSFTIVLGIAPSSTTWAISRGPRVLVVEDDPHVRELIAQCLISHKIEPCMASSAREALQLLEEASVDAIVTDHLMPEVEGPELAREARSLLGRPDLPIIAVTAMPEEARQYEEYDLVVAKPFRTHELAKAVTAAIESRKLVAAAQ